MKFTILLVGIYIEHKHFMETAQETIAVISDVRKERVRRNGKYRTDYDIYVQYEVDGVTYNQELNGSSSSMRVGSTIVVYYDPENPRDVRSSNNSGMQGFAIAFSLVFVVLGAFIGIVPAVKFGKLKKLKETGQQITAVITEVVVDKTVRINKRHPYKMICEAVDPLTNEKYIYSSESFVGNIDYLWNQQVTVYYDPYDKDRYYVDIDSVNMNVADSQKIYDFR